MADNGFVKLRRGILEHVEKGLLSKDEFAAYVYIILRANHQNGVWLGSAAKLAAAFGVSRPTGKRWLQALRAKGYVERALAGRTRGSYAIKVSRYRAAGKQQELFPEEVLGLAHHRATSTHQDKKFTTKSLVDGTPEMAEERNGSRVSQLDAEMAHHRASPSRSNTKKQEGRREAPPTPMPATLDGKVLELFAFYGKRPPTESERRIYHQALCDLTQVEIDFAFDEAFKKCCFLPRPAEIRQWVRPDETRRKTTEEVKHERSQQAIENVFGHRSGLADRLREGLSGGNHRGAVSSLPALPRRAAPGAAAPSIPARDEK